MHSCQACRGGSQASTYQQPLQSGVEASYAGSKRYKRILPELDAVPGDAVGLLPGAPLYLFPFLLFLLLQAIPDILTPFAWEALKSRPDQWRGTREPLGSNLLQKRLLALRSEA